MITILLSTYNGEKYLKEQLESLLGQTEQGFIIIARDDASTDGTADILKEYAGKRPDKIFFKQNNANSGGAKHNFIDMMIAYKSDYTMLCDQDDVWLPDKIAKTLGKTREMEKAFGKDEPLLVHTDLRVVDKDLNVINPSFKQAMNADYNKTRLRDQLIQNTLTGCAVMYNKALGELILEKPRYMVMHDWWLILTASAFGKVGHINDQTILYRQHGGNMIGAKDVRKLGYKLNKLKHVDEIKEAISITYKQAESFLEVFKDRLSNEQKVLLTQYISIPKMPKWKKWQTVLRLKTFKNGFSRNIAYFIFI